jgi:L,D-peptidoglycan transpeptidase YkuD (ErfK/YbiS/YcfS/YnhG family)
VVGDPGADVGVAQAQRVRGPVRVRLGYNGWVPAGKRRQSTGTTPAGNFAMRYAFGNRADPGAEVRYERVDGDHVQRSEHTAGCVAGPIADIRWIVRWLDPDRHPRIVMGPTAWVKRRF